MEWSRERKTVAAVVVALGVGWWLGSSPSSPINPTPKRPLVAAVSKLARAAARLGLWLAVYGSKPPDVSRRDDEVQKLVRMHRVDENGNRIIDHSEGW